MTSYISATLRELVSARAGQQCEYCKMSQSFSIYAYEVDHTVALKHGGATVEENLALSCISCNRHKGSDLTSIDPITGQITPLFNPRLQNWADHFRLEEGCILGLTPTGRTTVFLLKLNEQKRLQIRKALISEGLYP